MHGHLLATLTHKHYIWPPRFLLAATFTFAAATSFSPPTSLPRALGGRSGLVELFHGGRSDTFLSVGVRADPGRGIIAGGRERRTRELGRIVGASSLRRCANLAAEAEDRRSEDTVGFASRGGVCVCDSLFDARFGRASPWKAKDMTLIASLWSSATDKPAPGDEGRRRGVSLFGLPSTVFIGTECCSTAVPVVRPPVSLTLPSVRR